MSRWIAPLWCVAVALGCSSDDSGEKLPREKLMDPQTCEECHPKHYEEWSGSMHAYASEDPVFRAMNARGQDETDGALGDFCVNCHAPLAVREGLTEDGLNLDDVPDHMQGITCYFCHNVEQVNGTHNNPLILANDQTMRGGLSDPVDSPAHDSAYSPLTDENDVGESSSLCGACHDIVVPKEFSGAAEDVRLERTFSEWKTSLFGANGEAPLSCSGCHMNVDGDVPIADYEGVPTRRYRHRHDFPGVDLALTPFPRREQQLGLVRQFLDASIRVEVCVAISGRGIKVSLESLFAGHNFPSGATQDRRFWAEVRAFDVDGVELYSSGAIDDLEAVAEIDDPDLMLFRDEAFDKDGNVAHMFWDIASIEEKTILAPVTLVRSADGYHQEISTHTFNGSFDVPRAAERVTVRLRMRPMGLEVLRDLVESDDLSDEYLADMQIVDLLPNRRHGATTTIEWTQQEAGGEDGYASEVGGLPALCLESANSQR